MEPLILTAARGRVALSMTCVAMGADLAVTLAGGDRPHIGAVALSQPRPSHAAGAPPSASTSVLTLLGHKEDELARAIAAELAARLGVTACVACGIHLDAITPAELAAVDQLGRELAAELAGRLGRVGHPAWDARGWTDPVPGAESPC